MSTVVNVGWTCGLRIVVSMLLVAVASVVQAGTVKVAVVGGIQLSGVWDALRPRLEAATGVRITLAAAANKAGILPVFVRGDADLLLIHGGAETFALQARGVGGRMSVWAYNEHAIVGPADDPAGVHGSGDAATAFRRIAAVRAPFIAFRDPGSHEIVQRVWKQAGITPTPEWVRLDVSERSHDILELAAKQRAYVVVGAIPVSFGRMQGDGMALLLRGDPAMRRAYVALEPGEAHPAKADVRDDVRKVVDYLVSSAGQAALAEADRQAGGPWLYGREAAVSPTDGRE